MGLSDLSPRAGLTLTPGNETRDAEMDIDRKAEFSALTESPAGAGLIRGGDDLSDGWVSPQGTTPKLSIDLSGRNLTRTSH